MIKAGELNTLITLQRRTKTQAASGQTVPVWVDVTPQIWAGKITTGGGEFYAAQKVNGETTALFKIRYTSSVNAKMQIKHGNAIYQILFINDVNNKHEELLISTKEVT